MKHNFILKILKGLLILLAITNPTFGQYAYLPEVRGLYVDDFIKLLSWDNNQRSEHLYPWNSFKGSRSDNLGN